MIKKKEILSLILSILMANVIINFDGMFTDLEITPYDGSLYVVAPVDGDSTAGSVYKIVLTSPPELIKDPASPENTITFPTGIESKQGDQPKNIEEQITKNNNSDISICDKLKSFDKVSSYAWIERKITDEQVMYLGQQVKELMVETGCIQ